VLDAARHLPITRINAYVAKNTNVTRKTQRSPLERFADKVALTPSGCWEWTGCVSKLGYGWLFWNGRATLAHRWIFEASVSDIPPDHVIDHLCRNRKCVNPSHLECVTMGENTKRGTLHLIQKVKARNQTQCKNGHPLFGPNLALNAAGHRYCRTCQRANAAAWKKLNRARVNERQNARRQAARAC
jgi:hypothetical protein